MGSRGPQPTPTARLKLRGSWRGETRDGEPEAEVSAPKCPDWLTEEARAEWDRVVPELIGRGTLSKADRATLTVHCHAWGQFVKAAAVLEEEGYTSLTAKGIATHPMFAVQNKAIEQLLKAADRFGLSPSAKARVRSADAPQEKTKSALDGFKLRVAR